MAVWVLLFAALAAADTQMSFLDSGMNYWGGPERGCTVEEGAGQMILTCTLPSGNLTLYVERSAASLKIICERNSTLVCDELQEAKPHIDKYIANDERTDRHLTFLRIETCALSPESLACPLGLVGAVGTALVRLEDVRGRLEEVHVKGLEGVTKFRMYGVDDNTTEVPYSALSLLPNLKSFSMKRGSLVLKQEDKVLPELTTLELAQGGLKALPKAAFKNMPKIQTLLLWGNKIEYVDVDAFEGLSNLVNLSLNGNLISHLPGGLFRHSPLLGRVDLYVNKLVDLSDDLFSGLLDLKEILIFDNNAALKLGNLTFSDLPSLHNLKLERCSIDHIAPTLFQNTTNLKTLSLQGNKITYIPDDMFSNQTLITLNLSNNSLSYLPSSIFDGQKDLTRLELQLNSLEVLPDGLFFNLKSLKYLDLGYNRIESLNRSVFNGLNSLTDLFLAGNRIQHLNRAVFEFTSSLENLSLAMNNLTISKEKNTLKVFPQPLYELDDNETMPQIMLYDSPFRHLNLKSLDLSYNNVSVICDDWGRMFNLDNLNLSHNNFTSLSDVDMNFPTNVTVDFRYNNIQNFQPNYNMQTYSPTFEMDHNPYKCDCKLYEFISSYRRGRKMPNIKIRRAECHQPEALKGVKLSSLEPESLTCEVDCYTGSPILAKSNSSCYSCTISPEMSRLEMLCDRLPEVYPKLSPEVSYTYVRVREATDVPKLPPDVRIIDFSSLNLTQAPKARSIELNLTNNALTSAPIELFENNCTLHLRDNPFDCSCEEKNNVLALNMYKDRIPDYKLLTCSDNVLVSNIIVEQLCATRDAIVIGTSLSVLGLIIVIFTVIAYKYTTEIRILLRKLGLWYGKETDDELYDAFVSFAHQDEDFVRQKLIPKLENGRPSLKICIHYRDWVIGEFIPAQIARSVDQSRYTIIVLSKHFVNSMWGRMEFRTAHTKDRAIILMLDDLSADKSLDPELKAYIAMNTYVKADDPLVWDRLKDAVLKKKWRKDNMKLMSGLDVHLEDGKLVNKALTAPSV